MKQDVRAFTIKRFWWLCLAGAAIAALSVTLSVSAAGHPLPQAEQAVLAQAGSPAVTLSKTVVNPAGDTITVTGTGFLPSLAIGTRPPLAGVPAGAYIAFGAFAEVWKPSAGAPSSARPTMTAADGGLKWAVPEASRPIVGQADSVTLNPDGSFTAVISVKKDYPGALANGLYGIYTYAGSGAVQPLYETYTPVTFTAATATATSSASPSPTATATAAPPSPTAAPPSPTTAPASPTAGAPNSPTVVPKPPATGTSPTVESDNVPSGAILLVAGVVLVAVAGASAIIRRS